MPLVEAVLMYRPEGYGADVQIPVARTGDPGVLRALRERVLAEMEESAASWGAVDEGIAAMEEAEAERVRKILLLLLPDTNARADLRLVEGTADELA